MSLVPGRQYSETPKVDSIGYPILTAQNFLKSFDHFKNLIYNDISPIGFYPGGPSLKIKLLVITMLACLFNEVYVFASDLSVEKGEYWNPNWYMRAIRAGDYLKE